MRDPSYACVYTQGLAHRQSQHNIFDSEETHEVFLVLLGDGRSKERMQKGRKGRTEEGNKIKSIKKPRVSQNKSLSEKPRKKTSMKTNIKQYNNNKIKKKRERQKEEEEEERKKNKES